MFNLHITLAMALTGLTNIVNRFGQDHIATNPKGGGGCTYYIVENGVLVPVCIVGQFFADLGILRVLAGQEGACSMSPAFNLTYILEPFGITIDDEAKNFLNVAQQQQDSGKPWGEAVETAARDILAKRGEPTTSLELLTLHEEITESPDGGLGEEPLAEWEKELLEGKNVSDAFAHARGYEIRSLIDNGRRIEAIKEIKFGFNLGLKEAKEVIDSVYPR